MLSTYIAAVGFSIHPSNLRNTEHIFKIFRAGSEIKLIRLPGDAKKIHGRFECVAGKIAAYRKIQQFYEKRNYFSGWLSGQLSRIVLPQEFASCAGMPYNSDVSHLDILFPFGLPPPELARDLLRELKLPALATLMARAKSDRHRQRFGDFARALPHEVWLASQFGLAPFAAADVDCQNSPALACATMRALGLAVDEGVWFMLHPSHIHIAHDHLVLTDIRQVNLSEADSRALFDAAAPLFAEVGRSLQYGDGNTWFMRADDWQSLLTATPDASCGHNIDIWIPQGNDAAAWHKLQNEVQMMWFAHPINEQRAAQGLQAINSLWLWAGATATAAPPSSGERRDVFNLPGGFTGLSQYAKTAYINASAADIIATKPENALLTLDQLIQAALTGEWSAWQQQLKALESDFFEPLLQAIQQGRLDSLSLCITNHVHLLELTTSRFSLKKFWLKPSLTSLLPVHSS